MNIQMSRYKTMVEVMGIFELQSELAHADWRGAIARTEFFERIVAIRIDTLLGYDEPGWHSVSPMYGAIEYQGSVPQGVRQSRGDRMCSAAERLRFESSAERFARSIIDQLPPRHKVALLVDGLRQRYQLTQAEACRSERWGALVSQLQLTRWLSPSKLSPIQHRRLSKLVSESRQRCIEYAEDTSSESKKVAGL